MQLLGNLCRLLGIKQQETSLLSQCIYGPNSIHFKGKPITSLMREGGAKKHKCTKRVLNLQIILSWKDKCPCFCIREVHFHFKELYGPVIFIVFLRCPLWEGTRTIIIHRPSLPYVILYPFLSCCYMFMFHNYWTVHPI